MAREVDKRNLEFTVPAARAVSPERSVSAFIREGAPVTTASAASLDPFTGSMLRIEAADVPWEGSPRLAALEAARAASEGTAAFVAGPPADFALPQEVRKTGAGTSIVHVSQHHLGLPVFQAGRTVQLRSGGRVLVTGASVEMLTDVESDAELDVLDAVRLAAEHLAREEGEAYETGFPDRMVSPQLNLAGFAPTVAEQFNLPMRPTLLKGEPFAGHIKAHLSYFYQGPDLRLAWHVELVFPDRSADYEVLIAAGADAGEVLYARNRVCNLLGECEVHTHNPQETPRSVQNLPPAPPGLPATLRPWPAGIPWLSGAATAGNNVTASDDLGTALAGTDQNGTILFQPSGDIEAAVVNTFYFCNLMHDFFYALGFDEASGNFQAAHPNNESGANDAVRAWVFDREVTGVATMQTPPDGAPPTMRMGKYGDRHTGFDSDVVFHEFVHGVTNRLVGGRLDAGALSEPQSRGMGEGWGDYFALTYQNVSRETDKNVTGDWVTNRPNVGIRGYPYDDTFLDGFGALGSGRYRTSVHARGEIWCATLMKATRCLAESLNDKPRGYAIAWQAVVDGLKLAPANPSFVDARNAILQAIGDFEEAGTLPEAEVAAARRCFWHAFAHFGMGINATSRGATLVGIVADHQVPAGI